MPLSEPPSGREPVATREIACRSFRRADGMWDVEGHLADARAYGFANRFRGWIEPGEPLHDMWLRLTVDAGLVVRAVEAATDAGPYEACPAILPAFRKLEGMRIGPGWNRRVRERLGGMRGCTHLVDLLGPLATVAFHTVLWARSPSAARGGALETALPRPPIDSCHVWASDGPVVRDEHPEFYTGEPG